MYVFVYGTLKKNYRNNILLAHSRLVGNSTTKPLYRLYDCGMYPCLVKAKEDGRSIRGEVWEVDDKTMLRLDQLEGVPWLYQRGEIELTSFPYPVIAYFYQEDVSDFADCGNEWPRKVDLGAAI